MYTAGPSRPRYDAIFAGRLFRLGDISFTYYPRPSNARLARLEAENQELHRQLGAIESRSGDGSEITTANPGRQRQEGQDSPSATTHGISRPESRVASPTNNPQSTVSRIFISPSGESSYHRLTSTLFDDTPTDRHDHTHADLQVPVEHIRKRLMGEAAYQSKSVARGLHFQCLTAVQGSWNP